MSCLAIITARGGSKRIPKKNIKEFCGKPIIAYSIEAAINSGIFDEVMVSTDSKEIADIAIQYGAKVPFMRSENNSNDFATTNDVLCEVVNDYKEKKGKVFDFVCCLYPTAPFVTATKLKETFDILKASMADQVVPVVKFSFPPQRCFVIDEVGDMKYKWPENQSKRSQDLEPYYHDAGQFYFYKAEVFYDYAAYSNRIRKPYVLSEFEVQDIDTMEDWEIAEIKFMLMQRR